MSLPKFELQGFLFESLGSIAADLFDQKDKYKLFARKVWPLLAGCREELAQCYEPENGRPGIEPVVLLGVLIFQFMEQEAKEAGWQLVGPAQPSASRVRLAKEYRIEAFDISITERKAVCPDGKTSTNCSKLTEEKSGKVTYRFEFGSQCHSCPHKAACVPSALPHRTIVVGAYHEELQQRRRNQQSEEFQLRMHQRNAIEGTISELVRGLRSAARPLQRTRKGGSPKSASPLERRLSI
jgi:hypothetical protein